MTPDPQLQQAVEAFQSGELDRAREIAERALATAPSPQWQHLLGITHCRLGNAAAGVEHLRAAAQADPGNMAFQVMLARALVDAGQPGEVLAMPEPPAPRTQSVLALWVARAEAAVAAGQSDTAAGAWLKIVEATPNDWRAWGNLGAALGALDRWPEAAEAMARAARLNADDPALGAVTVAALVKAGRQHQTLLRFDQAVEAFRSAHELAPSDPSVIYHLGVALERTNRLEALEKLVADAASAGIDEQRVAYLRALLAWREGRAEDARALLEQADPGDDPLAWNALKTKVADSLGDSDAAFEAAEAMNRAAIDQSVRPEAREEFARKSGEYRQEQRALARTITPEWASKLPVIEEPPRQRVAFLLGFPRSGTTLLDTFLLGHPEVAVLEEKQLIGAAGKVTGPIEELPSLSAETLEEARATYFRVCAEHVSPDFGGTVVDKFPLDMGAAPLIHAMFPGAPIIFMQRHPCDVVLSGFLQPFGTVNFSSIADAADYYDAMMSIWSASLEALPLNVHTAVYEDLVEDPESVVRPVIAFLGLDWDEAVLDHRQTARERGTIVTPSYDQVTEPITKRPSGRWKRYREQLEPVLPILLPWAQRLGYRD